MSFIRTIFILLCALLLLTACGGVLSVEVDRPDPAQSTVAVLQTQVATLMPAGPLLSMQSDSETIRQALLNSYLRWDRLWVSGLLTEYVGSGQESQSLAFQAWIDQPNARFRMLQGVAESAPGMVQISDGANLTRVLLPGGETEQAPLPEGVRAPFTPPAQASDTIEPHPVIGLMDSSAKPVFYPGELAQRGGEYRPVELTEQAGRPALLVEWQHDGQVLDRLWIDSETGHLLRWQSHGKGEARVVLEVMLTIVRYDPPFADTLFDARLSEPPAYVSDVNAQATPSPEAPVSSFEPGEGQLYFVSYGATSGLHLVRLPSSCISGAAPCKAPAVVPGYPNIDSSIEPMYWSPDGSTAAVLIYDQLQHTNVLWLYHAADDMWTVLAQFPVLYGPVVWSPDSQFVSFSAMTDPSGIENLFALSIDGEWAFDLTAGTMASDDSRLSPVTWINNQSVVFQFVNRLSSELFVARLDKSLPTKLNSLSIERGVVTVSPDRTQLMYSTQDGQGGSELWLAGLDGSNPQRLFSIQSTSIQQIEWSPDGRQVAFITLSTSGSTSTSAVYTVGSDGGDLRQLYQSPSLARLAFAPDVPWLVVEDNQLSKLVALPLDGGPASIITAPGLLLDDRLLGISWRAGN